MKKGLLALLLVLGFSQMAYCADAPVEEQDLDDQVMDPGSESSEPVDLGDLGDSVSVQSANGPGWVAWALGYVDPREYNLGDKWDNNKPYGENSTWKLKTFWAALTVFLVNEVIVLAESRNAEKAALYSALRRAVPGFVTDRAATMAFLKETINAGNWRPVLHIALEIGIPTAAVLWIGGEFVWNNWLGDTCVGKWFTGWFSCCFGGELDEGAVAEKEADFERLVNEARYRRDAMQAEMQEVHSGVTITPELFNEIMKAVRITQGMDPKKAKNVFRKSVVKRMKAEDKAAKAARKAAKKAEKRSKK